MIKLRFNKILPQTANLTPAKVRLIARLKGDGSIFVGGRRKTNYFIKYESNDNDELNSFSTDIKNVYGLDTKENKHRSGKKAGKMLKQVFIRSKYAFEDMQKYGPFYSENWRVPATIKESDADMKKEFMRTFFEDEGSVIDTKSHKEVRLYSKNIAGLMELVEILKDFGIKSEIKHGFGEGRNVGAITIKGEDILKFGGTIGFRSSRKNNKLAILTSKLESRVGSAQKR